MELNILIAYPYINEAMLNVLNFYISKGIHINLMLDSGAFTAFNSGKPIDLEKYCDYIKEVEATFLGNFKCVQLDVIGNEEQTLQNYLYMKNNKNIDCIPVFTRGSSLETLEELYRHTDYVMLGGVAKSYKNKEYVKWFLEKNKDDDGNLRKVHLLGFTNNKFIKHYDIYSCDSSSINCIGMFGNFYYLDRQNELKSICLHSDKLTNVAHYLQHFKQLVNINDSEYNQILKAATQYRKEKGSVYWYLDFFPQVQYLTKITTPLNYQKNGIALLGGVNYLSYVKYIQNNFQTKNYIAIATIDWLKMVLSSYLILEGLEYEQFVSNNS